jgi:hypothetical protein
LPKDLDGLISAAESRGHDPSLLREISAFNRRIRESTQTEHELTQTKRVVRRESEPLTSSNGHREVGASPRLATGGRPRRVS